MKRILYTGLTPPLSTSDECIIHHPLIEIFPRTAEDRAISHVISHIQTYTHIIFTSKTTARIFCDLVDVRALNKKMILSVGKATSSALEDAGIRVDFNAEREQAEGIIDIFPSMKLEKAHILWPHSDRARSLIADYLRSHCVEFESVVFYETKTKQPKKQLPFEAFDVIVFTSPSTVDGFLKVYGVIPSEKEIRCIGPVTEKHLQVQMNFI